MAVQKSKVSRSRRGMRRSHDAISLTAVSIDAVTGETHRRHHITKDGFYRGKKVLDFSKAKTELSESSDEE